MAKAFGIDISKYNSSSDGKKKVDFNKVKANKEEVVFVVARAGASWGYKDPIFDYYWAEMQRIQVCRVAYHVLYFGESALAQMDNLFKILKDKVDWKHDKIALDLEVAGINTKERITATTKKCMQICKSRTGHDPILYSRANWANQYLDVNALPKADWWLAQYRKPLPYPLYTSEHPGPPDLPKNVSTHLIQQTGEKGKSVGGVSYYMDYNRWNGTKEDVYDYFGFEYEPPAPPKPEPVLFQAKCVTTSIYTRGGPSSGYPIVGALMLGDIVDVYEEKEGWYRIEDGAEVWCSANERYMQRIKDQPNPEPVKFQAKCIVNALYKRSGPGTTFSIIGYITKNTVVKVYEEKNDWYRIGENAQVWVSAGSQYMQKI